MSVSFIIPTLNRPHDLERLLNSIINQSILPEEVVIVDQSDNSKTESLINAFKSSNKRINFIYIHLSEKSSAKARNEGFRNSKNEFVCFTDDDIVLDKDYLQNVLNYFKEHKDVGCVSGSVMLEYTLKGFKWFIRKILMRVFLISYLDGKMTASGFGFPIFQKQIQKPTQVQLLAAYSMNFRREYFLNDQFDEWFSGYSFREDVELSYRISNKTKIVMIPDARFQHRHSSTNRLDLKKLKTMQFRNYHYVFQKHKGKKFGAVFLFYYSIIGFIVIDFLEWITSFNKEKFYSLRLDLVTACKLALGRL